MAKISLSDAATAFLLNPCTGNTDLVFRAYYADSRVATIIRSVTDRYSVRDVADEITQDLAVLLLRLLPGLDEGKNVYSLLYATAQRCCFTARDRQITDSQRCVSLDWDDGETKDIPSDIDFQNLSIERLDKEAALAEFSRRMGYNKDMITDQSNVVPLVNLTPNAIVRTTEKKYPEPVIPNIFSAELLRIRNNCGMTNIDFAERLEITEYMLSSYIYGRATIPAYVIERAQQMETVSAASFSRKTQRYEGRPMSEIMTDWIETIGITDGQSESGKKESAIDRLAMVLDINKVTAWRWSQNRARPGVAKLAAYEQVIARLAKSGGDARVGY